MRIRSGLELGIRAEMDPIVRAAEIARKNELDYFLVPETHPKMAGVNAFEALGKVSCRGGRTTMGTGIVSVHSRYKEEISREIEKLCPADETGLVIGLGASTAAIARMWGHEKANSLSKLKNYTMHLKYNMSEMEKKIKVFWGVSRDRGKIAAASRLVMGDSTLDLDPDGIILHMETSRGVERTVGLVKDCLGKNSPSRPYSKFEVAAIRLVYFVDHESDWKDSARRTIANYVANNPGYSPGLARSGFTQEVDRIKTVYDQIQEPSMKLSYASAEVSDEMLEALTTHGTPREVAEGLYNYGRASGAKAVIAGVDMGKKDYYRPENIKNLEELAQNLHW